MEAVVEKVEVNKKVGRKRAKWTRGRLSKWIRQGASLSFGLERSNIYGYVALLLKKKALY